MSFQRTDNDYMTYHLMSFDLYVEYSTSRDKTQSYFKDQPVYRCEVEVMRRLNYFFEIFYSFFYKNKRLGFDKNI